MKKKSSFFPTPPDAFSLLEVVIAMGLLAVMVTSAVLIQASFHSAEITNRSQLAGIEIMRQAMVSFDSGLLTNSVTTAGTSETSFQYSLSSSFTTNNDITNTYTRMLFDLSIQSEKAGEAFGMYLSKIKLPPLTDTNFFSRTMPDEDKPPVGPTFFLLEVQSSDTSKGTVMGSGTYAYGTQVTIMAIPVPPNFFIGWNGATVGNSTNMTTTIFVDDDKKVTAQFTP
jgi:type II secretory pathway pseudopilin PulG